jgi:hypothetical protein
MNDSENTRRLGVTAVLVFQQAESTKRLHSHLGESCLDYILDMIYHTHTHTTTQEEGVLRSLTLVKTHINIHGLINLMNP